MPPPSEAGVREAESSTNRQYDVSSYAIRGAPLLSTNLTGPLLARYAGTNVHVAQIVNAASALQSEYIKQGYTTMSVAVVPEQTRNGIVTLNVFRAAFAQILVSGRRYFSETNITQPAGSSVQVTTSGSQAPMATAAAAAAKNLPSGPTSTNAAASPSGTNAAPSAAAAKPTPKFAVRGYEITGDTVLPLEALQSIFGKYTGTNITIADIMKAGSELQLEYRARGYPTLNVTIPPQQITNGLVKIHVFEGVLSQITVTNNHFFSSDNILRALPSVHVGSVLVGQVFQSELDRANMNKDRQIYPQIEPGPREGTSVLILDVKDRLPLHGKVELNNYNSPGTPDLRLNTSVVYDNLWQHENSLGLQYSFSPTEYKLGEWPFYNKPLVANYSAIYRLPLGSAASIADTINTAPGSFGYDEATRQFRMPPPSGNSELSFYASGSTIDTGVTTLTNEYLTPPTNSVSIRRQVVQRDLTYNYAVGTRLSVPMVSASGWRSIFSSGLDYKSYALNSYKTNNFIFRTVIHGPNNQPIATNVAVVPTAVPTTVRALDYLPFSLSYNGSLADSLGSTTFGLGLSESVWYSGSLSNLQFVTGSTETKGNWFILTPSVSRDFNIRTNWTLTLEADGQWANEPLVSNEQFGAGGVSSVRGYHEGEVFGDTGWHCSLEQKTPPYVVGVVHGGTYLTVRGSIYMDAAETFLIAPPPGQPEHVPLWGTGFGGVASVGTYFQARFLFSWPLLTAGTVEKYEPRFNFSLTAQF
jgi:hemolysin activation/secretion protein